jgi:uncharacterized membrane protein (UPF0182 family)
MSDPVNWPHGPRPYRPQIPPPRRPIRLSRWLLAILIGIGLLVSFARTWLSYYVDALWFESLGYLQVFSKSLSLQWTVFALFAAATFVILFGSFRALKKTQLANLPASHTIFVGGQPVKLPVEPVLRAIGLVGSIVMSLVTGAFMMAEWSALALYWYASPTAGEMADPIFGKPLSFYLFTLPAWQLISGWLMFLAVIIAGVSIFFMLMKKDGNTEEGAYRSSTIMSWTPFSITFAAFLLVLAVRVYLSRYDSLFDDHTIFSGVTYTEAHVTLPGLLFVCVALILGALIAIANAFTPSLRRVRWLLAAVAPAAFCYIVLQIAGWYVQSFIAKPNELVREQPYITHNIQMTRQAYALDHMTQRQFPAETSVEALDRANNQPTLQNIRLWDWRALQDTLRQIQEIRTYYDFPDVDIDRYEIDGKMREVMLATRELNVTKLPESSRNWINEKLIYTHGYGITMNPVNGFNSEGLPDLFISNMPVQSTVPALQVKRPEVYFGELTDTDVYVKTRQKEFNYPQGETNSFTSYEGSGGIVLGGFLRRILIAFDRGDIGKLPFSDDVNSESRLLMRRNVRARAAALAPFLTFERDPYIVLGEDGRLYWIMDAFTTSDTYPYSRHYQIENNSLDYIRNSVKVVIDAYDGSTTLYAFDPQDPVLAGYRRIFPSLFKDASAMPPGLRKHVRYPELMLSLQAQVYGLYHMTDPQMFYNREDLWSVAREAVPSDSGGSPESRSMQPNFVLMKLPGESDLEFVEILPFIPNNRNNLIGWIAGRSDGANYGTSVVYNFPKTKLVDGPLQIEARIDQNAQLSGQLTLWNQQGSHVRRGTMLVIPCGHALLYAEPIYLQAAQSPMPELRLVVLALQDRLAYGPTFEAALLSLFGAEAPSVGNAPATTGKSASPGTTPSQTQPELSALISEAARDLSDYQRLTAEGKLGEAGQKLEELKRVLTVLESRKK